MANYGNNNYIPQEVQNNIYQDYIYSPTQSDPNLDFSTIKSIADIPHKVIKQPSPNEFYIPYNEPRWPLLLVLLVSGGFCSGLICVQIYYDDPDKSVIGIYIGIALTGFIFIMGLYGNITNHISMNIFLEDNSIRIVNTWNCCCFHSTTFIRSGEIRRFDIEEITKVVYFDNNEKKTYFLNLNFFGDEARYLVYVLNNHLNLQVPNTYASPGYTSI